MILTVPLLVCLGRRPFVHRLLACPRQTQDQIQKSKLVTSHKNRIFDFACTHLTKIMDLVQKFLGSSHGAQAKQALLDQGMSDDEATSFLSTATEAGAQHVHDHAESNGFLGEHPGRNFFAAFAAGIVKGDGVLGSLGDGFEGALVGRITEAVCNKTGMDSNVASTAAAAAAPFVASFLKQHLAGAL